MNWLEILYGALGILVFIFVLGLIILIHEGGHFLVAKKSGILCHEFSIGMGPKIWGTKPKKDKTVYNISAIPIGVLSSCDSIWWVCCNGWRRS